MDLPSILQRREPDLDGPAWASLLGGGAAAKRAMASRGPVFIWQMGKVGSGAFTESIERLGSYAVFHFHHTNANTVQKVISEKEAAGVQIPDDLRLSQKLLTAIEGIKSQTEESIYIVSAVRDPVARNVSAFFQNLEIYAPDAKTIAKKDIGELRKIFLEKYHHKTPVNWFDRELLHTAGIDIYETRFDRSKRALLLSKPPFQVLVLRAEDDDIKKAGALNEFFGRSDISLEKRNDSRRKKYGKTYAAFLNGLVFDDDYMASLYDTRYSRHFYSDEELNAFQRRWRGYPI